MHFATDLGGIRLNDGADNGFARSGFDHGVTANIGHPADDRRNALGGNRDEFRTDADLRPRAVY